MEAGDGVIANDDGGDCVGNVDDGSHHFVLNILVQNKYAICI